MFVKKKAEFLFIFFWNSTEQNFRTSIDVKLNLSSQMVLDNVQSLSLLAEGLDDDARAAANLPGLALLVDLAEATPFAQLLAAVDTDQRNLMFTAQGNDELFVLGLVAALSENAQHSLTSRKRTHCH